VPSLRRDAGTPRRNERIERGAYGAARALGMRDALGRRAQGRGHRGEQDLVRARVGARRQAPARRRFAAGVRERRVNSLCWPGSV
jgi:hypothetical protein